MEKMKLTSLEIKRSKNYPLQSSRREPYQSGDYCSQRMSISNLVLMVTMPLDIWE